MQIIEKLTWICLGIISGFEGKISIVQYNYNCARDFYRQPFGLTIDFSFEYLVLCFENLLMFVVSDGCELWAVMNPVHLFHVSNLSMFKLPDEWVSALGHSDIGEYYEGENFIGEWWGSNCGNRQVRDIENSAPRLLQGWLKAASCGSQHKFKLPGDKVPPKF